MRRRTPRVDEFAIAALLVLYTLSFSPRSLVASRIEVLNQDTWYLVDAAARGEPYPFNPQHHVLVHLLFDAAAGLARPLVGSDREAAYALLEVVTLGIAAAFLLGARLLLVRIGLGPGQRALALLFAGTSVSAWFHLSTPETHALAFPALALYLAALWSLTRGGQTRVADRVLLAGSIAFAGLARIDQWRLLPVTAAVLLLPALRGRRRRLALDLAAAGVLGLVVAISSVAAYRDLPWSGAARVLVARTDTKQLAGRLGRVENLDATKLARVARGIAAWSLVMPLPYPDQPDDQRHRAFWEPFSYFEGRPASALLLAGVLALVSFSAFESLRVAIRGDPFHVAIWLYVASGWIFYTWFNPWEPFLWLGEFLVFHLALVACALRGRPRAGWTALGVLTAGLALHNGVWFWNALR